MQSPYALMPATCGQLSCENEVYGRPYGWMHAPSASGVRLVGTGPTSGRSNLNNMRTPLRLFMQVPALLLRCPHMHQSIDDLGQGGVVECRSI